MNDLDGRPTNALTLLDLLAYDAASDRRATRVWQRLAEQLDGAGDGLSRATGRAAQAWPTGPAGEASHHRGHELVRLTRAAVNPARRIAQALDDYASSMSTLHREAASLSGLASMDSSRKPAELGARVGGRGGGHDEVPGSAGSEGRLAVMLGELLGRAREVDDRCAAVVRGCFPESADDRFPAAALRLVRSQVQAQATAKPAAVAAWWRSLTSSQRAQVLADFPDLVGGLDGLPAVARDQANRTTLAARSAWLDRCARELAEHIAVNRTRLLDPVLLLAQDKLILDLARVRAERAGLDQVRAQLDRFGRDAYLLKLDPVGDGLAVIAIGNPDTARHTAVWVPGVSSDLGDTAGNLDRVTNLRSAADRLTAAPDDVAAVMWLGYDTPDVLDPRVLLSGRAEEGAGRLDTFIDGLNASHDGTPSHVTAVGHSYGSVVIAEAATAGNGLAVQDIVVVGSPGMRTDHASDLHLAPQHVWAGSADHDLVSGVLGHLPFIHGEEPTDASFGANEFVVDTDGHSAYWTPGSTSLDNQARIVVGRYQDVTLDHGRPPDA